MSVAAGLEGIPGIIPNLIDPPAGCRFNPRCEHVMDVSAGGAFRQRLKVGAGHSASCFLYAARCMNPLLEVRELRKFFPVHGGLLNRKMADFPRCRWRQLRAAGG